MSFGYLLDGGNLFLSGFCLWTLVLRFSLFCSVCFFVLSFVLVYITATYGTRLFWLSSSLLLVVLVVVVALVVVLIFGAIVANQK